MKILLAIVSLILLLSFGCVQWPEKSYATGTAGDASQFGDATSTTCWIGGTLGLLNCTGNVTGQNVTARGQFYGDINASYVLNAPWVSSSQITELNASLAVERTRITEVNGSLQTQISRINEVNVTASSQAGRITEVNNSLQVQMARITETNNSINAQTARINSLNSTFIQLVTDNTTTNARITELNGSLATERDRITALNLTVVLHTAQISEINGSLQAQIARTDSLNGTVVQLALDNTTLAGRLAALNGSVIQLATDNGTLYARVNSVNATTVQLISDNTTLFNLIAGLGNGSSNVTVAQVAVMLYNATIVRTDGTGTIKDNQTDGIKANRSTTYSMTEANLAFSGNGSSNLTNTQVALMITNETICRYSDSNLTNYYNKTFSDIRYGGNGSSNLTTSQISDMLRNSTIVRNDGTGSVLDNQTTGIKANQSTTFTMTQTLLVCSGNGSSNLTVSQIADMLKNATIVRNDGTGAILDNQTTGIKLNYTNGTTYQLKNDQLNTSKAGTGGCAANQWATATSTTGVACLQPAFTNVSGSVTDAQTTGIKYNVTNGTKLERFNDWMNTSKIGTTEASNMITNTTLPRLGTHNTFTASNNMTQLNITGAGYFNGNSTCARICFNSTLCIRVGPTC